MLFTLIFILLISSIDAQTLIFSYDSSGNQVERIYDDAFSSTSRKLCDLQTDSELFFEKLQIYPNPTYGFLTIKWDKELVGKINNVYIKSLQSEMLLKQKVLSTGSEIVLDLSYYKPGYYILYFVLKDGNSHDFKLIKK